MTSRKSASKRRAQRKAPDFASVTKALDSLDQYYTDSRSKYERFLKENEHLPRQQRADAWMRYVARNQDNLGDSEALVYLLSRGVDCESEVKLLIAEWRDLESRAIESARKGVPIYNASTGKTVFSNRVAVENIENTSEFLLMDFWGSGPKSQAYTLDATMLRTVEWAEIHGFDQWWRRLARLMKEAVLLYGVEENAAVYRLFNLTRSNFAVETMKDALSTMRDACSLPRANHMPWETMRPVTPKGKLKPAIDIEYASSLIFADARLGLHKIDEGAVSVIQDNQNADGSWPVLTGQKKGSVLATATAVHALAIRQPRGSKRQIREASKWLWSCQESGGLWWEEGWPDPTHLSVLVLDAIALANSDGPTTFTAKKSPAKRLPPLKTERRFKVALSFAGEVRKQVHLVADLLRKRFGKGRVLYDKFHAAEFARPNLDTYLQDLYKNHSDLIIVWVSPDYKEREWCGLEWRAIRELIKLGQHDRIMFLKSGAGEAPEGMMSSDGFVDVSHNSAPEITALILQRLRA